jgi:hypothetical protein
MLKERSPLTIGSVAVAFEAVCPTRLDLLHKHYRRLCRMLVEVDEWGQVDLMNLLLRYTRTMLPRPVGDEVDVDVKLLLQSVEPILMSYNPAVGAYLCMYHKISPLISVLSVYHGRSESDLLCGDRCAFTEGPSTASKTSAWVERNRTRCTSLLAHDCTKGAGL